MQSKFEDKGLLIENHRQIAHDINPLFVERWSPRAFDKSPIPDETLGSIFEAARWSMSCFNEQPWLFAYATEKDELELYLNILNESNRRWAVSAPVLGFIFAKRRFKRNDKENHWAKFDCGAAWMALTMQARMMGLYTHGMAGFDHEGIYEKLGVPESDYAVVAAFALGRYGDKAALPEDIKNNEQPNDRKRLHEIIIKGKYSV